MNQVQPRIFQGNYFDAVNADLIKGSGITCILNVAFEANYETFAKGSEYARVPMIDGPGNPLGMMRAAAMTLESLYGHGHSVLVHCMHGRSRSAGVILAWLMVFRGMNYEEATALLHEKLPKAVINPAHITEIQAL